MKVCEACDEEDETVDESGYCKYCREHFENEEAMLEEAARHTVPE